MRTIWKYKLPTSEKFTVEMPGVRKFLTLGVQHDMPHIWVEVDPESEPYPRHFRWVGTGNPIPVSMIPNHVMEYRGTWQMASSAGEIVFHLYEEIHVAR